MRTRFAKKLKNFQKLPLREDDLNNLCLRLKEERPGDPGLRNYRYYFEVIRNLRDNHNIDCRFSVIAWKRYSPDYKNNYFLTLSPDKFFVLFFRWDNYQKDKFGLPKPCEKIIKKRKDSSFSSSLGDFEDCEETFRMPFENFDTGQQKLEEFIEYLNFTSLSPSNREDVSFYDPNIIVFSDKKSRDFALLKYNNEFEQTGKRESAVLSKKNSKKFDIPFRFERIYDYENLMIQEDN